MDDPFITFGLAAVRIGDGVQHHHLHRLAKRGLIPFTRAGGQLRLIAVTDLPAVRAACELAGYARPKTEVAHVG